MSSSNCQISYVIKDKKDLNGWKRSIRARVTALKCHIMASKGLTPNGEIVKPYSSDLLLNMANNAFYVKEGDPEVIEDYITRALERLPLSSADKCEEETKEACLEDVDVSVSTDQSLSSEAVPPLLNSKNIQMLSKSLDVSSSSLICQSLDYSSRDSSHDEVDGSISKQISIRENELCMVKEELNQKEIQVSKLLTIQDEVENELQDLTANLFQEAHGMVLEANIKAANSEKNLKEANMHVEVLQAEVAALKALVITSTPSTPNPHLHPQIISRGAHAIQEAGKMFQRGHKKSSSDLDLKYGRDTTPPNSPVKEGVLNSTVSAYLNEFPMDPECWEVDPVVHKEFVSWRQQPTLSQDDPFMSRIYVEDINLCLGFSNSVLAHKVSTAVEQSTLHIEEVNPRQKNLCPKKCVLLDVPRYCKYRFRLGENDENWYYISQLARNRIIAVCDFLNYLRYIIQGLVKSSIHDVYWEVVKLRRQMSLARLGF